MTEPTELKCEPDRVYSKDELQAVFGTKAVNGRIGISFVDVTGDYSQYDFDGNDKTGWRLHSIDGVELTRGQEE